MGERVRKYIPWDKRTPGRKLALFYRWSATKTRCFYTCPLQFYFIYINPVEVPVWIAFIFGQAIHHQLERFYKYKYVDKRRFLNAWRHYWMKVVRDKYPIESVRWNTEDAEAEWERLCNAGMAIMSEFWDNNMDLRDSDQLLEAEKHFSIKFREFTLHGYIDRRTLSLDGLVEIVDYKTGFRWYLEPEMLRDVQFTFYQLAEEVLHRTRKDDISLAIHRVSIKEEEKRIVTVPTRSDEDYQLLYIRLEQARAYLLQALTNTTKPVDENLFFHFPWSIEAKPFLPNPGSQCSACDYEKVCRVSQFDSIDAWARAVSVGALWQGETDPGIEQLALGLEFRYKKDANRRRFDTGFEKHKRRLEKGKIKQLSWKLE